MQQFNRFSDYLPEKLQGKLLGKFPTVLLNERDLREISFHRPLRNRTIDERRSCSAIRQSVSGVRKVRKVKNLLGGKLSRNFLSNPASGGRNH